jgi:hypothetical protein
LSSSDLISGKSVKIYTFTVATVAFVKARRDPGFKKTLLKTAVQVIEEKFDEKFYKKQEPCM